MERLTFDGPATYRIQVRGRIKKDWSDRLEGMAIVVDESVVDHETICTLEGVLSDQAALAGVLNTLYELHLPVLLVKRLSPENKPEVSVEQNVQY